MAKHKKANFEWVEVLTVRRMIPKIVYSRMLLGRCMIFDQLYLDTWSRLFSFEINSEGVSAYLCLENNQRPLCLGDIEFCETELLRWVQKQLHIQSKTPLSYAKHLLDELHVQEFQDIDSGWTLAKPRNQSLDLQFPYLDDKSKNQDPDIGWFYGKDYGQIE